LSNYNPDNLNLTKEQILKRLDKIENRIAGTKEGKIKAVKFKLVFGFIKWLVNNYDLDILNNIFLGIITEFDDLRYENALNSDDPVFNKLKKIEKGGTHG